MELSLCPRDFSSSACKINSWAVRVSSQLDVLWTKLRNCTVNVMDLPNKEECSATNIARKPTNSTYKLHCVTHITRWRIWRWEGRYVGVIREQKMLMSLHNTKLSWRLKEVKQCQRNIINCTEHTEIYKLRTLVEVAIFTSIHFSLELSNSRQMSVVSKPW
jgi:hypothetical protein